MAYKPSDKSRFDRAKELATRVVDESNQGDGFTLVLMGSPPRVVVATPAFEPRQFREEIDNLRLPHGGGDLPATLSKVEDVLQAARREYPRLTREEVYFLTDLGRTSWAPEWRGSGAADEFRSRSQRLAQAATLVVLDLGQADSENMAITQLASLEPFATLSRYVTLEAEVRNFGRQPRPHQLVELFVDGRRTGEEYVDVDAQGRATVSFPYRFDSSGSHAVELRLAADLLDIDNHRWLALDGEGSASRAVRQRQAGLEAAPAEPRSIWRSLWPPIDISPSTTWCRLTSFPKAPCWKPIWPVTIAWRWRTWASSRPTRPACSNRILSVAAG